ncbi:MAG: hypothetical protein HFJ42_03725 [Clostridia bacterium]|nr:hypothetical protein [Clostridia bacterium]
MKKGKVNMIILILLILLVLALGVGVGTYVGMNLNNKLKVSQENDKKQLEEQSINKPENKKLEEIEKNNEQQESENIILNEEVKYDGSKEIIIQGKTYTVSYLSEKFEHIDNNELKQTEVKLYLNDKKIKTLNLGYIIDVEHTYGNKGYEVELHHFCEEYILIEVKQRINDGEYEPTNAETFCIVNTNGEHIETFEWNDATQITDTETNEKLTYKINNDSLILYEDWPGDQIGTYYATEIRYTVIRDYIKGKIIKIHKNVILAGK